MKVESSSLRCGFLPADLARSVEQKLDLAPAQSNGNKDVFIHDEALTTALFRVLNKRRGMIRQFLRCTDFSISVMRAMLECFDEDEVERLARDHDERDSQHVEGVCYGEEFNLALVSWTVGDGPVITSTSYWTGGYDFEGKHARFGFVPVASASPKNLREAGLVRRPAAQRQLNLTRGRCDIHGRGQVLRPGARVLLRTHLQRHV